MGGATSRAVARPAAEAAAVAQAAAKSGAPKGVVADIQRGDHLKLHWPYIWTLTAVRMLLPSSSTRHSSFALHTTVLATAAQQPEPQRTESIKFEDEERMEAKDTSLDGFLNNLGGSIHGKQVDISPKEVGLIAAVHQCQQCASVNSAPISNG